MKYLYLIRHAKSSWSDPGLSDFDRPLNKRGKRDTPFMGTRMAAFDYRPEMIISSSAKRARKTARTIGAACGFKKNDIILKDSLYTFSANGILESIRQVPDSVNVLAVVGHNHGLTECAELLSGEFIDNVPTCGVVLISFSVVSWDKLAFHSSDKGKMLIFDYPKRHATGV